MQNYFIYKTNDSVTAQQMHMHTWQVKGVSFP